MQDPLLSFAKAAERVGISKDTLRWHVLAGDVRFVLIGSGKKKLHRLFDIKDLEAFVESRKRFEQPSGAVGSFVEAKKRRSRQRNNSTSNDDVVTFLEQLKKRRSERRRG